MISGNQNQSAITSSNFKRNSKGIGLSSLDMLGSRFSLGYASVNGKFQTNLGGF